MKVCKFGGTSLATAEQIKKVAKIIMADPARKIIVVSAPGKRFVGDVKITDLLIQLAEKALQNENYREIFKDIVNRYQLIIEGLGISEQMVQDIEADLIGRLSMDTKDPIVFMDAVKAAGENNLAKCMAAYLTDIGLPARFICPKDAGLLVNPSLDSVRFLQESYESLADLQNEPGILVFPGFFGYTKEGVLRTFNRGGSDITGAILAAAINAEVYENFTDVDAVYAANPTIIDQPASIKQMTYREMRELAYAGFSVFHDEALMPAFEKSIPVCIKNTNNPNAPGTMIVKERDDLSQPVIGIAADSGFSTLFISKYLMNKEIGFGRRLLQILEDNRIPYEHIPSGIDNLSVIIRSNYLTAENKERIIYRVITELEADDVHWNDDYSMVVLVGEGMRKTRGLAARATLAIARTGANIEMINQGSSEVSLVFGVRTNDETIILKELYEEFFKTASVYA